MTKQRKMIKCIAIFTSMILCDFDFDELKRPLLQIRLDIKALNLMVFIVFVHMVKTYFYGAYKKPREITWMFGVVLFGIVLGFGFTGYLLPWDQKGYWATTVATKIMGSAPLIGEWLQQVVVGGHEYGHHTLTRFFALHAGVLPAATIALTAGHIYLFRRHGVKSKEPHRTNDEFFWPEQVLKDAVACLGVLLRQ